jgi:hypothetical protein
LVIPAWPSAAPHHAQSAMAAAITDAFISPPFAMPKLQAINGDTFVKFHPSRSGRFPLNAGAAA